MKKICFILLLAISLLSVVAYNITLNGNTTPNSNPTEAFTPTEITVAIDVQNNENNSFTVSTNLPDGTTLMLTLFSTDNSYRAQDRVYVYNGKATSGVFTNKGSSLSGEYTLEVTMPVANQQSKDVQKIIGSDCEYLKGNLVTTSSVGKIVKARFDFTLIAPKSELDIIKETSCNSLTKSQKLSIIYWIEARYEYYDKLAGGYSGDKYTQTIFNEAAERYSKTYQEINSIWGQSYELKYK